MHSLKKICEIIDLRYQPVDPRFGIEPIAIMVQENDTQVRICMGALIMGVSKPWFLTSYHLFDGPNSRTYQIFRQSGQKFATNITTIPEQDILSGELSAEPTIVGPFGLKVPRSTNVKDKQKEVKVIETPLQVTCVASGEDVFVTHQITYANFLTDKPATFYGAKIRIRPGHSGRVFIHPATQSLFVFHGHGDGSELGFLSCLNRKKAQF